MTWQEFQTETQRLIDSMTQSMQDPQQLHAIAVHAPIMISVLGLLLVLAVTVTWSKVSWLRWSTVGLYVVGAVAGWGASEAGEFAASQFDAASLSAPAAEELQRHTFMGEWLWIGMLVTPLFLALTAVKKPAAMKITMMILTLLTASATAGWVGITAHHGGQLVYVHGVGVPSTPNNLNRPPAPTSPSGEPTGTDQEKTKAGKPTTQPADQAPPTEQPSPSEKPTPPADRSENGERKPNTFFGIPTDE